MVKATLFVDESQFNWKLVELLKKLASEPIDESLINLTNTFPGMFQAYTKSGYWLKPIGRYSLLLPKSFFKKSNRRFFNKAFKAYQGLLQPILHLQVRVNEEIKKNYNPETHGVRPITYFSVIAEVSKKLVLCFLITDPLSEQNFKEQLAGIKLFIQAHLSDRSTFAHAIRRLHKIDGKTTFLLWNEFLKKWELANLLFLVGHEKMLKYKIGLDPRFAKPHMIVNATNLNREFTFTSNWTIFGGSRHYTMNKPNDIAVYRSIADKSLIRARVKFQAIHSKHIGELTLTDDVVSEFFDYFEEIIQATIMSYTTIECMANSCIPFHHQHKIIKKGITTIYDKPAIELQFTLRDKLKEVIPPIFNLGSPVREPWWQPFIELEEIRNEIIHSKEIKAETRYSTLVNEKIFDIVSIHRTIVTYYAEAACRIKAYIMNEFPIGVGCDEIIPGLMSDKEFKKSYKSLHNIP